MRKSLSVKIINIFFPKRVDYFICYVIFVFMGITGHISN